ncbi:hypothetical protein HDU98_000321 [Podochytrium sp. JEL0797]|nr:hypothetical protein HDU98_000321 [Podochytrium sp. JEL0797]
MTNTAKTPTSHLAQHLAPAHTSQQATITQLMWRFAACSMRASPQRQKALPALLLTALLVAHTLKKKAASLSAHAPPSLASHHTTHIPHPASRCAVPPPVAALLACPVDLMLTSLMLAETILSDSQTSTASWARLAQPNATVTPEARQRLAQLKWTAFEFLDYNLSVSRDTFIRWCAVVRKSVPSAAAPADPSVVTAPASPPASAHATSPSPIVLPLPIGYSIASFPYLPPTPSATPAKMTPVSDIHHPHPTSSAMLEASKYPAPSLPLPHFFLDRTTTATNAAGGIVSSNARLCCTAYRAHPYQRPSAGSGRGDAGGCRVQHAN